MTSKIFCDTSRLTVFWIVIISLTSINLSILYYTFFSAGVMSLLSRTICSVTDSLILFLPFIFVNRKYLYIVLIWFIIITLLIFSNIIYFRNFNDAICASAYFAAGNINSFVINSVQSSVNLIDITFLLTCAISISVFIIAYRAKDNINKKFIYSYIAISLIMLIGQIGLSIRRISIYNDLNINESINEYRHSFNLRTNWKAYIMDYGIPGYIIRVLNCNIYSQYKISHQDITEAINILHTNAKLEDSTILADLKHNRDKNLILIIVESLNSKVLELDEADNILPVISKLSKDSTVLYFQNIEAMTGHGRSSDAQFMINTGLLPLRNEAVVTKYADADYPSLSKTIGHSSIEIIGEEGALWSHYLTTKSYGFDRLIDNVIPDGTPVSKYDSLIFDRAKKEISNMEQPFFMQITTLGMHKPYINSIGNLRLKNKYTQSDYHYLEAVHAFDLSCGDFLKYLKNSDLYDNSIIVIVSDHEESVPNLSDLFDEKRIPMLILNSSLLANKKYSEHFYQIDIFPTILDIIGHSDSAYFHGVGKSMIRGNKQSVIPIRQAFEISEKLIKSEILRDSINASFVRTVKKE